eukprot:TRINITY_DN9973_c0_g1_i2.p1 TRINITY_DN9973_c0_g1~~TRINITY_DN9973_c0_g1_i2.p1  ORF type:complete len:135 (-),score=28.58 TRINITY_DN9973_c0_g1_i2:55-459(-)
MAAIGQPAPKDRKTVGIVLEQGGYCKQGNFVCMSCVTLAAMAPADQQNQAFLSQISADELQAFAAEHAAVVAAQGGWQFKGIYQNYDAGLEAMKELVKRWTEKLSDRNLHLRYGERHVRKGFRHHELELEYPVS